mmetsp:Transcript_12242/g.29066  ORF Transcript_12242/g.29066 Transcript_12242/m.29066 type:complete len:169 (+) Transcript_12242:144-650(+)
MTTARTRVKAGERSPHQEISRILKAETHYDVLGVPRSSSVEDIKRAYKRLALLLHPDKSPVSNGEEAFKVATQAYACLKDPQKRSVYDRWAFGRRPSVAKHTEARAPSPRRQQQRAREQQWRPRSTFETLFERCGCAAGGGRAGSFSWPLCIAECLPWAALAAFAVFV